MARINNLKLQANNRGRMCACIAHNLRTHDNHSNKDIDPSKSGENVILYDLDYNQTVKRLYDRLAEIGKTNTNKRKDRVEMIEATIPYPRDWQQLTRDQQIQWGMGVIHYMQAQYGKENVIQAVIHFDEIHDYIDPNTKQITTSRPHIHVDIVPEKDGRLASKELHSRKLLQNRNEAIDKWTKQKFGILWKTGEYKKGTPKRDIDQLKAVSANLADIQRSERLKAEAERKVIEAEKDADIKIMSEYERAIGEIKAISEEVKTEKAEAEAEKQEIKNNVIAFHTKAEKHKKKKKAEIEKIDAMTNQKKIEYNNLILKGLEKANDYNDLATRHNDLLEQYNDLQLLMVEMLEEIKKVEQQGADLGIRFDWGRLLNKTEHDDMDHDEGKGEYGDDD